MIITTYHCSCIHQSWAHSLDCRGTSRRQVCWHRCQHNDRYLLHTHQCLKDSYIDISYTWVVFRDSYMVVIQQPPLPCWPNPKFQLRKINPLWTFATKVHAWNKQYSVVITDAAESILGEGVASPAGTPIRAQSVDTMIFTEMGIFWTFIDVYICKEEEGEMNMLYVMPLAHTCAIPSIRVQPISRPALATIGANTIDTKLLAVVTTRGATLVDICI